MRYSPEDQGLTDLIRPGDNLRNGAADVVLVGEPPLDLLYEV
jgi:hypothetical protein